MNAQDQLEKEYRKKRRAYEEQEEDLLYRRNKGIQELEDIAERVSYYLRGYAPDPSFITAGIHELEQMKEEVFEAAAHDQKQLERKVEDLEENHFQELRKLANEEA